MYKLSGCRDNTRQEGGAAKSRLTRPAPFWRDLLRCTTGGAVGTAATARTVDRPARLWFVRASTYVVAVQQLPLPAGDQNARESRAVISWLNNQ